MSEEGKADSGGAGFMARDVHRGLPPFVLLLVVFLGIAYMAVPRQGLTFISVLLGVVAALVGYFAALAAVGFRYVVSDDDVEVKGLIRAFRKIPRRDIGAVSIVPAPGFPGWGIRAWGDGVAYYWGGKRVVKLETTLGSVYLGSDHPERLLGLIQQSTAAAK